MVDGKAVCGASVGCHAQMRPSTSKLTCVRGLLLRSLIQVPAGREASFSALLHVSQVCSMHRKLCIYGLIWSDRLAATAAQAALHCLSKLGSQDGTAEGWGQQMPQFINIQLHGPACRR